MILSLFFVSPAFAADLYTTGFSGSSVHNTYYLYCSGDFSATGCFGSGTVHSIRVKANSTFTTVDSQCLGFVRFGGTSTACYPSGTTFNAGQYYDFNFDSDFELSSVSYAVFNQFTQSGGGSVNDWSAGTSSGSVLNDGSFLGFTLLSSSPEWTSQTSWYATSAVPASGAVWNPASNGRMVVVPALEPDGTNPISYDDWTASSPHLPLSVIYQIGDPVGGVCYSDYVDWETQPVTSVDVVVRGHGVDDDLMFVYHPNASVFVNGSSYCIRASVLNGVHSGVVNYGYATKFTVNFDSVISDLGGSLVWDGTAGGEDTSSIASSASMSDFCHGKDVAWYVNPVCYFLQFLDWLISPTEWTVYWFSHLSSFVSNRLPFGWASEPVRVFSDSLVNYDCELPVIDASSLTASTPTVVSFNWQFDFCSFWSGLDRYFSNYYIQLSLKLIVGAAGLATVVGFARIFF